MAAASAASAAPSASTAAASAMHGEVNRSRLFFGTCLALIPTGASFALVSNILVPLKHHGVSMTRFESRPARSGQWEYYFYIDLQGHPSQPHVAAALKDLQSLCAFYKVLGTYPLGE